MAKYARGNPAQWWKSRSFGRSQRSPHAMFVSPWRRMLALLALVVLAVLILGIVYLMSPKRLSRMASIVLSHVLDGEVSVKTAHLSLAGTLQLSGVLLRTHQLSGPGRVLFSAAQVQLGFNWLGLITGRLHALRLVAIGPRLNLVHNLDTDRWNYQNFVHRSAATSSGTPSPIQSLPVILLQHASIRWGRISHGHYKLVGESFVQGRLQPRAGVPSTYQFEIDQRTQPGGKPGIHVAGSWNLSTHAFAAHIRHIALNHALRRSLPLEVSNYLLKYDLQGNLRNIVFRLNPTRGITLSCTLAGVTLRLPVTSRSGDRRFVPVGNLAGVLTFSRRAIVVSHLSGKVMGNGFQVPSAVFDGYTGGQPFQLTLLMPNLHIPRISPWIIQMRGFGAARAIFNRLRPSGNMALTMAIGRATAGEMPVIHGRIALKNVRARYVQFPYPMHQVHGIVDFSSRAIHFVHVQALAENFPCSMNGTVGINSDSAPIDLHIASRHAFFDRRLAACLPRAIQGIWNRFQPNGTGRFICHVTRAAGTTSPPLIAIHIFPVDVRAHYHDFPYPLRHVHGELFFTPTQTKIIRLTATGPENRGHIVFTGTVKYNPDNLALIQPRVRLVATGVPLGRKLLQSLPRYYSTWIKKLYASGLVSMDALITRGSADQPAVVGTIGLTGGTMRPPELPWPLHQVQMQAGINPDEFNITQLTAMVGRAHPGTVQLHADIKTSLAGGAAVQAGGSWQGISVNPIPAKALPPKWKALWAKWRPSGQMDGRFAVGLTVPKHTGTGGAAMAINTMDVHIMPKNMALAPSVLPQSVANVTGIIHLTKHHVTLHKIAGTSGPIHFQIGGDYVYKTQHLSAHGHADATTIPAAWIAKLPVKARHFITPLTPEAHWNLQLSTLTRTGFKGRSLWNFKGQLQLNDVATHGGIKSTCEHASTAFTGTWDTRAAAPEIHATMALAGFSIAGQTLQALTGQLSTSPVTRLLKVEDIDGAIAGGALSGYLSLRIGKVPAFHANLILDHAELADLLSSPAPQKKETRPTPVAHPRPAPPAKPAQPISPPATKPTLPARLPPPIRPSAMLPATTGPTTKPADKDDDLPARIPSKNHGKVTASFQMDGIWGQTKTMRGNGILLVRHADIYNVPLAMGLLQVATLRLPVSHAFKYCKIVYTIKNGVIHFKNIILSSPGVDLDGQGHLQLATQQLRLTLITHSPAGTQIPVLGLLFGLVRSQLLQLQVYGTLTHPVVVPTVLNILEMPFRAFSH